MNHCSMLMGIPESASGAIGITSDLARKSGFLGVVDLLKVAKHGPGDRVYLVEFDFHDTA